MSVLVCVCVLHFRNPLGSLCTLFFEAGSLNQSQRSLMTSQTRQLAPGITSVHFASLELQLLCPLGIYLGFEDLNPNLLACTSNEEPIIDLRNPVRAALSYGWARAIWAQQLWIQAAALPLPSYASLFRLLSVGSLDSLPAPCG